MATGKVGGGSGNGEPKKSRNHGWHPVVYCGQILAGDLERALNKLEVLRAEYRKISTGECLSPIGEKAREITGQWLRCVDAWREIVNDPDVSKIPLNAVSRVERFDRVARDLYANGWIAQIPAKEGLALLLRNPPPPSHVTAAPPLVRPAPVRVTSEVRNQPPAPLIEMKPPPPPAPVTSLTPLQATGIRVKFLRR